MNKKHKTQKQQVLALLKKKRYKHVGIASFTAIGVRNPSAVISQLRRDGHVINTGYYAYALIY